MKPRRIGVLAGAFNPVTRAHLALSEAAHRAVDEVVCVVPRIYPHKVFHGASLDERIAMLRAAGGNYRVEVSVGGLFIDIAREIRSKQDADIHFICGRDAAERIIGWDYGEPDAIDQILEEFSLQVADRDGSYQPPERLKNRVHPLILESDWSSVSSTEVRRRIASGEPWEHLVPTSIVEMARRIYSEPPKK